MRKQFLNGTSAHNRPFQCHSRFSKFSGGGPPDLPPVGFAPSALAGDWLRRPVLSGKHARAHQKSISSRTPMSPNILAAHLTTLRYTDCDSHIICCGERAVAGRSRGRPVQLNYRSRRRRVCSPVFTRMHSGVSPAAITSHVDLVPHCPHSSLSLSLSLVFSVSRHGTPQISD